MSFVISSSQRLASEEKNIAFQKITFNVDNIETEHFNVGFGQPLYTIASDIVCFRCAGESAVIPAIPCSGITLAAVRRGEEYRTYACGPNLELKKIQVRCGDEVLLFRFSPGSASRLLTCSPQDIAGAAISAEEIVCGIKQIRACLCREIETDEKVKNISSIIRTYLVHKQINEIVNRCIDRIYETNGNIKVEQLAAESDVTARYIGRLFEEHVGISPKAMCETTKLNNALTKIMNEPEQRLTDIALECGYFDHTHMNKALARSYHISAGKVRKKSLGGIDYGSVEDYFVLD